MTYHVDNSLHCVGADAVTVTGALLGQLLDQRTAHQLQVKGDAFLDRLLLLPPPVGQFCKGKTVWVKGGRTWLHYRVTHSLTGSFSSPHRSASSVRVRRYGLQEVGMHVYDYNYRVPTNLKRNSMTSETSFSQANFPSF